MTTVARAYRILMLSVIGMLFISCSPAGDPFGESELFYGETDQVLREDEGFVFGTPGYAVSNYQNADFMLYTRGSSIYIGLGFANENSLSPGIRVCANLHMPYHEFDLVRYPPDIYNGNYRCEIELTTNMITEQSLYAVYTRAGHFALIGISELTIAPPEITWRYVYNPLSDNTYNRTLYEVR